MLEGHDVERMTLREAAQRTQRSITTLRRYIRSQRLHAEKRDGRFGPEYFVSEQDLIEAGLRADAGEGSGAAGKADASSLPVPVAAAGALVRAAAESVPLRLFEDLQLKHEQLLVQYGMARAGGLRALEIQSEVEELRRELDEANAALARASRDQGDEAVRLRRELREAYLELEGRGLEIAALKEKVRALEMLTRNAVTNETIEKRFTDVMDQARRVGELEQPTKSDRDH